LALFSAAEESELDRAAGSNFGAAGAAGAVSGVGAAGLAMA
jgi:hypothetical protein